MTPVMLWDFDGTLGRRKEGWSATMATLAHDAGHELQTDQIRPQLAGAFPWDRPQEDHRGYVEADAWWRRMSRGIARAYEGCGLSAALSEHLATQFREAYLDLSQWELFTDAAPTLEALSSRGWVHVVCSNHVPELPDLVKALGLAKHLKRVISSALVGWEKPHPAIYRAALAGLALPDQAWMAGDNIEADVLGPQRLGIRAVLVRGQHPSATHQCPDLPALVEFLADQT